MNAIEAIKIALKVGCMCRPAGVTTPNGGKPWQGEALEVSDTCFWRFSVFSKVSEQYHPTPEDLMYQWEVVGKSTLEEEESQEITAW